MKKLIAFCFVLLSFVAFAQTSNEENLKDWVFPKNIKEKKFELKSFEFGKTTNYEMNFSEISEKTFKIDNRKYEVDNNRILLSEIDLDYDVNTYTENNIYWELPESEKIKTWKYAEINGYFINFKSYWKTIDGIKFLITERITIDKYNRSNNLRKVEYYQKYNGLTKVDLFDLNTKKLSETHKELSSEKFVENGNLPESNRDTLSIKNLEENQLQAESFTDGKIVKYYKIVIEKDEGLPYLIKDSLNIYNSRGVEGIPPPKIDLKEESIYYDGSRIYRSGLRKMKIVKTVYFKEPFSINRELYYCDGEKNFYKVINDKLQMSIHDKVESEISSDDFQIQKNEIDKNSEIYKELNGQVKEQGIYVLIKETTEDNVRTQRIRKFNFKKNDD